MKIETFEKPPILEATFNFYAAVQMNKFWLE